MDSMAVIYGNLHAQVTATEHMYVRARTHTHTHIHIHYYFKKHTKIQEQLLQNINPKFTVHN